MGCYQELSREYLVLFCSRKRGVQMRIFCMSDIHGCLAEFEEALNLITEQLEEEDTQLILLGDYVHGGADGRRVLDKIMNLQMRYGSGKVIALLGNHEEWVLQGSSSVDYIDNIQNPDVEDDEYIHWLSLLPRYYVEGNTIFVHAGIDEDAGDLWEWGTGDDMFTGKYPAEIGKIKDLNMKVVAGHVGTAEISGDSRFHDIYYDGASHYYIDGTVLDSGWIPVLMVDTKTDKYYRVTESGAWLIMPYEEEN